MNPSMTPTSPAPMPAISLPPVAAPFPEVEAVAAEPLAVAVALLVAEASDETVARSSTCPKVGSGTSPFTTQLLSVAVGHAGGFLLAV